MTQPIWFLNSSEPSSMAAIIVTAYVSNRSAAMPAQSPTLSPTLSAITAGLRGSSSGIPASTLPTRSAPTSAALVYMPPPSWANSATKLAPKPNATICVGTSVGLFSPSNAQKSVPTPSSESATTLSPVTAPPRNEICSALFRLVRAADAVRILLRIDTHMPLKPASVEQSAPETNEIVMRVASVASPLPSQYPK